MARTGYKALLIGNSTFPRDRDNLPVLEGPVNDVVQLREALTDHATGLFPSEDVRVVPERQYSEILVELEEFFSNARRDDTLLLYYSGHGLLNESGHLFLGVNDTRTSLLRSTAISNLQINMMIEGSAARTVIIILDCCHSGAFKGGDVAAALSASGRYVLASSRRNELANDTDRRNGTSLFTQHLVEALQDATDHDEDGLVDLSDVYDYVYERLNREGRPIPQRRFDGGGDVAIAARPPVAPAVAAATPAEAAPELTLSRTEIEIANVGAGESVPPERIWVTNRGGGTLDWTVECDAKWIDIDRHEKYFVLTFRPLPGTNRANVEVFDAAAHQSATLRVTLEMRTGFELTGELAGGRFLSTVFAPGRGDPAAPSPADEPAEPAPAPAPATKSSVAEPVPAAPTITTGPTADGPSAAFSTEEPLDRWLRRIGAISIPLLLLIGVGVFVFKELKGDGHTIAADGQISLRNRQGVAFDSNGQFVVVTDLANSDFYFVNEAALGGARFWANNGPTAAAPALADQRGLVDLGEWTNEKLPNKSKPSGNLQQGGIAVAEDHAYAAVLRDGQHYVIFRVLGLGTSAVSIDYVFR